MLNFSEVKKIKLFNGFTLGEMLFVMIIIAILVALTTPIITKRTRTLSRSVIRDIWQYEDSSNENDSGIYFLNNANIRHTSPHSAGLYIYAGTTKYTDPITGTVSILNPHIELDIPHADTDNSTSAGFLANRGTGTLILGSGTTFSDKNNCIAIGADATANSLNSVAIGNGASTSGNSSSVAIGYNASANGTYSVAIGNGTHALEKQVVLGNSSSTLVVGSQEVSSDLGLKNIKGAYKRGIKDLRNLNTYLFTFKDDKSSTLRAGLIAQNVKHSIPEAIEVTDKNGHFGIKNEFINFAMFNAISDVDKSLRETVKKQFVLKHKVAKQEAEIRQLEKELKKLSKS